MPLSLANPFPAPSGIDPNVPVGTRPAACSWYDYIWPTQACTAALMAQQESEVPINAAAVAAYYAVTQPGSDVANAAAGAVPVAQQLTDANIAMIPSDMASVANPPGVNIPWWLWLGAGALVLALALK